MNGINLDERVSVETINRGKLIYQNQVPGNRMGDWYSLDKTTHPTNLGINPIGTQYGTGLKMTRVTNTYQVQRPTEMLRSTAAPALDTWSVRGEPFQTDGGGIQWFSTKKDIWGKLE